MSEKSNKERAPTNIAAILCLAWLAWYFFF